MKFRYYITNLRDGFAFGTDSSDKALEFAKYYGYLDGYLVVDSEYGGLLQADGTLVPVKENDE